MLIKTQPDATVCRYLFTAKLLYMLWVSQHPSSGVPKTVTTASSTGHNTAFPPVWPDRDCTYRCDDTRGCIIQL